MTTPRRLAAALLILAATPGMAGLEDRTARYALSIAGIPIGSASLSAEAEDGRYRIEGAAEFGFLFWGGSGAATAEGALGAARLSPERFRFAYEGVSRPGRVAIDFEDGAAARWTREPEIPERFARGRDEVAADELRDVLDPLSALVLPASADASPAEICGRALPIFSGYTRFDLALGDAVPQGEGVACRVDYRPISGHRRDSPAVERLQAPEAIFLALAPISEEFWGPRRIAVETRFGRFQILRRD